MGGVMVSGITPSAVLRGLEHCSG